MNWDSMKGQWKQLQGKVKEKWGKLTDDDLTTINGQKDQFVGKIQERYGYAKEQAVKEVDEFCTNCECDTAAARHA
ncbi:CsbD family protein [soil metagenome]